MADFGQQSSYGRAVLNPVDANIAHQLMAAGKPVYVVNASRAEDKANAHNTEHTVLAIEDFDYVERKLDYNLTRVDKPDRPRHRQAPVLTLGQTGPGDRWGVPLNTVRKKSLG